VSRRDKDRIGVVYSTDPEFAYQRAAKEEAETLAPEQQVLRVQLDRKQRKGKEVTLVTGFAGSETTCESLGKWLKQKCGVGGAVKDMEIILQGDHRQRVLQLLKEAGYGQTKLAGG